MFSIPDFSSKPRHFRFDGDRSRIDIGRCSAHWVLPDGRQCISEYTADRLDNLYETYCFSSVDIEDLSADELFEQVKASHLSYEHSPDIRYAATIVNDSLGQPCWVVDVCIAQADTLLRDRPPYFLFYEKPQIPIGPTWRIVERYRAAQRTSVPFLVVAGVTGSASWRDSDTYSLLDLKSEAELAARLNEFPCELPADDYAKFNLGVIDARDSQQPFNESVYCLAADWIHR